MRQVSLSEARFGGMSVQKNTIRPRKLNSFVLKTKTISLVKGHLELSQRAVKP